MLHFIKTSDKKIHVFTSVKKYKAFLKELKTKKGYYFCDYGNTKDGFLQVPQNHDIIMKQIAEVSGLTYDGNCGELETRLHADGDYYKTMNIIAMGRDTYTGWENALNNTVIQGSGFTCYAWNDSSSYDYHMREGTNYQQITVNINNIGKALLHASEIEKSISTLETKLSKFAQYEIEYAGYPTNEDIEDAELREIQKSSKVLKSKRREVK